MDEGMGETVNVCGASKRVPMQDSPFAPEARVSANAYDSPIPLMPITENA